MFILTITQIYWVKSNQLKKLLIQNSENITSLPKPPIKPYKKRHWCTVIFLCSNEVGIKYIKNKYINISKAVDICSSIARLANAR